MRYGHSHASPMLQRHAVQCAAGGCSTDVLDTALPDGAPTGTTGALGVEVDGSDLWKEVCSNHPLVPDNSSTTINVNLKETVAAP